MLCLPQAAGLGRQAREQLGADKLAVEVENIEWDPRKARPPFFLSMPGTKACAAAGAACPPPPGSHSCLERQPSPCIRALTALPTGIMRRRACGQLLLEPLV